MSVEDKARSVRQSYSVGEGYWFAQKRFGFGAMPVTWQGWALTIGYCALLMVGVRHLPGDWAKLAWGVPLTIGFVVLAWRKTEGGWHWHWGFKKRD